MKKAVSADPRLDRLRRDIARRSNPATREWWEKYLKRSARFHGTPMDEVRKAVHAWWQKERIASLGVRQQKQLALAMFDSSFTEQKLAGMLMLREKLLASLTTADLPLFARLFDGGLLADWNSVDWFSVKVLGPLVARDLPERKLADLVAGWCNAKSMWRRRASNVAFVNLAPDGELNFEGFADLMLEACVATIRTPERFAQTGAAWLLRELSTAEPLAVERFVRDHEDQMSSEARKMALARIQGASSPRG